MGSKWTYAALTAGERLNCIRNGEDDIYAQEVARTEELIRNRRDVGLDVSEQMDWLKKLSDVRRNSDSTLTSEETDWHMKTNDGLLQTAKLSDGLDNLLKPTGVVNPSETDKLWSDIRRGFETQRQSQLNSLKNKSVSANTGVNTANTNFGSDEIVKEMLPLNGSSVPRLSNTFGNTMAYAGKSNLTDAQGNPIIDTIVDVGTGILDWINKFTKKDKKRIKMKVRQNSKRVIALHLYQV